MEYFLDVFRSMIGQVYIWCPNVPGQHDYIIVKEVKYNGEEVFIGVCEKYPRAGEFQKIKFIEADVFLEGISQPGPEAEA